MAARSAGAERYPIVRAFDIEAPRSGSGECVYRVRTFPSRVCPWEASRTGEFLHCSAGHPCVAVSRNVVDEAPCFEALDESTGARIPLVLKDALGGVVRMSDPDVLCADASTSSGRVYVVGRSWHVHVFRPSLSVWEREEVWQLPGGLWALVNGFAVHGTTAFCLGRQPSYRPPEPQQHQPAPPQGAAPAGPRHLSSGGR